MTTTKTRPTAPPRRVKWHGEGGVLEQAAGIVASYSTGVTLRQLFYRLVSALLIPNTKSAYTSLSHYSALARREGWFPSLVDKTRSISRAAFSASARDAMEEMADDYRRDRTTGQEWNIYLGVEKSALEGLLWDWFGDLGVRVVALRGYSSESLCQQVVAEVARDGRPAVMLYGGDFDPSGTDIDRDFEERTDYSFDFQRIALNPEQIDRFDLPPMMGKSTDTRASQFMAMHGELIQVELDALPPDELRQVYQDALDGYWDQDAYEAILADERRERAWLWDAIERFDEDDEDE